MFCPKLPVDTRQLGWTVLLALGESLRRDSSGAPQQGAIAERQQWERPGNPASLPDTNPSRAPSLPPWNTCRPLSLLQHRPEGMPRDVSSQYVFCLSCDGQRDPEQHLEIPRVIQPRPPPPGLSASKSGKMGQFGAREERGKTWLLDADATPYSSHARGLRFSAV